ncbi:MAG: hypothetical protein H7345_17290, partial [Rubritepida sp.]|nr:hypothetical protein [Rubritepida sp.]
MRYSDPLRLAERGFAGLRVVGDVHGEARAFEAVGARAEAGGLFLIYLGELTDGGPGAPGVPRPIF